jgi:hypothetical protein
MARNGRQQAALITACAEAHSVSTRAVRSWRAANDPRWLEFVSDRAIESPRSTQPEPPDDTPPGHGLPFEIIRAERQCLDLARRIRSERTTRACPTCRRASDIAAESTLTKMLNDTRSTLHRLTKDTPGIQAEAGDLIPKTRVLQYAAAVQTLIRALPARLASIFPDTTTADIRTAADAEIADLCHHIANVRIDGDPA